MVLCAGEAVTRYVLAHALKAYRHPVRLTVGDAETTLQALELDFKRFEGQGSARHFEAGQVGRWGCGHGQVVWGRRASHTKGPIVRLGT